jgi:hypothetical protein
MKTIIQGVINRTSTRFKPYSIQFKGVDQWYKVFDKGYDAAKVDGLLNKPISAVVWSAAKNGKTYYNLSNITNKGPQVDSPDQTGSQNTPSDSSPVAHEPPQSTVSSLIVKGTLKRAVPLAEINGRSYDYASAKLLLHARSFAGQEVTMDIRKTVDQYGTTHEVIAINGVGIDGEKIEHH